MVMLNIWRYFLNDNLKQVQHWDWMSDKYEEKYKFYHGSRKIKLDRKANMIIAETGMRKGKRCWN